MILRGSRTPFACESEPLIQACFGMKSMGFLMFSSMAFSLNDYSFY